MVRSCGDEGSGGSGGDGGAVVIVGVYEYVVSTISFKTDIDTPFPYSLCGI